MVSIHYMPAMARPESGAPSGRNLYGIFPRVKAPGLRALALRGTYLPPVKAHWFSAFSITGGDAFCAKGTIRSEPIISNQPLKSSVNRFSVFLLAGLITAPFPATPFVRRERAFVFRHSRRKGVRCENQKLRFVPISSQIGDHRFRSNSER
jgi:hypothetical protein